jgi:hypothetical protein
VKQGQSGGIGSSKIKNQPLVIGSSPFEDAVMQRKWIFVLALLGIAAVLAVFYGAKIFISQNFKHVGFDGSDAYLTDAETNPEVLEGWMNHDLLDIPAQVFKPQFGYRMDVQNFTALLVAGSLNENEILPKECSRTNLQETVFECARGEIVAFAKVGGQVNLSITDFVANGTLSVRGQEIPYSSRSLVYDGVKIHQLIADVGSGGYVILQMPHENYSIARVMTVFSKAD